MTKPLVLKAFGVSAAILVITAGIVYFALSSGPPPRILLDASALPEPSVSVSATPSASPTPSAEPSEPPPVPVLVPVSKAPAPPAALSVTVTDVSFVCGEFGQFGPKVKFTGKVTVSRPTSVTIRTNMELSPGGVKASRFLPSVEKSETFSIEGAVAPVTITWSVEAGQPATWSQTMQQKNPC